MSEERTFDCSNEIEKYECKTCPNFQSNFLSVLKAHIRDGHDEEKNTNGDVTFLKYRESRSLNEKCKPHSHRKKPSKSSSSIKWFHCEQCSCKYRKKDNLERHSSSHGNFEPIQWFQCENCPSKFQQNELLKKHISLSHTQNSIKDLVKINFKKLPLAEKMKIKKIGRPKPVLVLQNPDKIGARNFTRSFSMDTYKKNGWVCGCDVLNALFCFPCVLFDSDKTEKLWSRSGYKDLKHLNQRMQKHETSTSHLNSCTELSLLGSINTLDRLNSVYRENLQQLHNEEVTRNRYVLKKIINCMKFYGKLELTLVGHDEKPDSHNRGILQELIDFSSELDTILKHHLTNSKVFKSKTIQNEILDSMLAVCRDEIKEQINQSDFLGIQCDETSDLSNHCQTVMILRYFYNGTVYERFWTFLKLNSLTESIENELEILIPNSPSKLIAQTSDGLIPSGIQRKIQNKYKNAHFVHCYAHQLNLIMQRATTQNTEVKMFFSYLSSISGFFSNSTHRCDILEDLVQRLLPQVARFWNYNIHTVTVVFENRQRLIECFKELVEKCQKSSTCREANDLRMVLEDSTFVFWLHLFHRIVPHVYNLFKQFQTRNKSSTELVRDLEKFEEIMVLIRNSIDETGNKNSVIAKKVCDTIVSQYKERLSYKGHLQAACLLSVGNFLQYSQKFPTSDFASVINSYPMLQAEKLKNELTVIYSRRDFDKTTGCLNMLSWISGNGLLGVFSESVKLLKIIVTTPMATEEPERCFPTLKLVKTFLKNTMNGENLDALGMLSMNQNLTCGSDFNDKVIERFISANDERKSDFVYK